MPINYKQIQTQTTRFCERAAAHQWAVQDAASVLMDTLNRRGQSADELIHLVEAEALVNKLLRCAKPLQELPASVYHLPEAVEPMMLIAADGSQINPSRHRQVDFGLINIATICMQTGVDATPTIATESVLLDDFDQHNGNTILTEDIISLERDIRERAILLNQARKQPAPVITLTDGPLELFRETGETAWFEKKLNEYIQILVACQKTSIFTAGYVDKPHSDLVNRMLRLSLERLPAMETSSRVELESIRVPDASLFSDLLSSPGDRSAIFAIQSQWTRYFKDDLQLCFFYLNVGRAGKTSLARVELPAWCTGKPGVLNNLHAAIYRQCEIMGSRPYPYILHRAHELALVTYEETAQLENMLAMELQANGLDAGVKSNKQSAKDLTGRGRYL
jgi:hypothetical protein